MTEKTQEANNSNLGSPKTFETIKVTDENAKPFENTKEKDFSYFVNLGRNLDLDIFYRDSDD